MIFLTAILRLVSRPETQPNDLLAEARSRIGHAGLTVIALVYVLVIAWQQ